MHRQHDFKRHALYPALDKLPMPVWSPKKRHIDDRFRVRFPQGLTEISPGIRRLGESSNETFSAIWYQWDRVLADSGSTYPHRSAVESPGRLQATSPLQAH